MTARPERTLRILAELDEVIVTWFRYEPGEEGPEPHVHRRHTDAFYVLEGELDLGLGPEVRRMAAAAGTLAAAPPNVVHTFRNSSGSTVVFLNFHAPSMGFGNVIRGGGEEGFDQFDPPADGVDPHSHDDHVDAFYVLEGEVEFLAGDEPRRGGPGTLFAAPRGVAHGFRNPGPQPIRVLNLHAPHGGFVDRVRRRG